MKKAGVYGILAAAVVTSGSAGAEELRVHVGAGAAHAIGGSQQRELGVGGGGSAAVELPVGKVIGVQAGAGAVALSKGEPPEDAGLAPRGTGTAMLGTVGVRVRPLGASRAAGPWIDANGGIARTGDATRPALDAHLGWDFRISRESRWDMGPFIGYTHVVQPDGGLRPDDARIAWVGIQISLGAREEPRPSAPRAIEPAPAPASPPAREPLADVDGTVEVTETCPDGAKEDADGCAAGEVVLLADRIHLDDLVHFEFGSARVRSRSHRLLQKLAKFINEHPEIITVSIEGHADAVGTDEFNQQLSEARAESTRRMLVRFGADPSRITVVGRGKSQLRVPSRRADERNRRVEFWVERAGGSVAKAAGGGKRGAP